MDIRGVWGGVRYDGGVVMAPPLEFLPRCLYPQLWLVGWEGGVVHVGCGEGVKASFI